MFFFTTGGFTYNREKRDNIPPQILSLKYLPKILGNISYTFNTSRDG